MIACRYNAVLRGGQEGTSTDREVPRFKTLIGTDAGYSSAEGACHERHQLAMPVAAHEGAVRAVLP